MTDQGEIVGEGLCHQHAVERITMQGREVAQGTDVPEVDRQLREAALAKLFIEISVFYNTAAWEQKSNAWLLRDKYMFL